MLHFIETGTGDPVVLLHAFPVDSTLWAAQRKDLAAQGYRVITPDLPGFGGSPPSHEPPSLDVMADEVAKLLDHLGLDRVIVGGLSMGGYVTMAMLRRHPEHLAGIILADTKAPADPATAIAHRLSVADSVEASGSTAALAEAMLPNLLGTSTRAHAEGVVAMVRRWINAQPPAGVAWAQRAMAERPDSTPDIVAFGGPVLVLHGDQDMISPAPDAAVIADAARSGGNPTTVVEIPDAGHLSAVENSRAVSRALLDWLATVER
ncbi:MAG: alpha/beta hydrolase [Candidatus Nanopelagicales bacterium]